MNKRKISASVSRINKYKQTEHPLEALLVSYHLNVDLIRFLLEASVPNSALKNKKTKELMNLFSIEHNINSTLKSLITKSSMKSVKLWLKQMDLYFKALKKEMPKNTTVLLSNGEAVFNLLNISANKLFAKQTH